MRRAQPPEHVPRNGGKMAGQCPRNVQAGGAVAFGVQSHPLPPMSLFPYTLIPQAACPPPLPYPLSPDKKASACHVEHEHVPVAVAVVARAVRERRVKQQHLSLAPRAPRAANLQTPRPQAQSIAQHRTAANAVRSPRGRGDGQTSFLNWWERRLEIRPRSNICQERRARDVR
eukprot:4051153-Pleurochrysis_carterae.AAC.1